MSEDSQKKRKCPRCGYEDIGNYCSQCSYGLNLEKEDVFRELYHSFILKYFEKFPFFGKFVKTWWRSLFTPGRIILAETYATNSKYLNDIKFVTTLFYFTLGSALVKSIFASEVSYTTSTTSLDKLILDFVKDLFVQSYILWIFGFVLLTFIWTGRIWKKWTKIDIKDQRQLDSVFIYEFGAVSMIILGLFWIVGYVFGDEITKSLQVTLIVLGIFIVMHFLYLLLMVGMRANLPLRRLIFISLATAYTLLGVAFAAEIITIPLILVPILVVLSPFFYLGRAIYRRFKTLLRIGV